MEGKEEQSFHQLVQHTCSYDSQLRQVNCVPFLRTFIQISSSPSSSSSNKDRTTSKRIEITHLVGSKLAHLETDKLNNLYVDIAFEMRTHEVERRETDVVRVLPVGKSWREIKPPS